MVDVAGKRKNRGALLGALLFNERIHVEDSRLGARGDRTPNFQGLAAEGGGAKRARAEIKQQPNRTKFKRWGPLEDAILASLVDTYGEENSWEQIASEMSGRTASACEQHWQVMNGQHANGQRPTSQQEANAARTTGLVPAPRPPLRPQARRAARSCFGERTTMRTRRGRGHSTERIRRRMHGATFLRASNRRRVHRLHHLHHRADPRQDLQPSGSGSVPSASVCGARRRRLRRTST